MLNKGDDFSIELKMSPLTFTTPIWRGARKQDNVKLNIVHIKGAECRFEIAGEILNTAFIE